MFNVEKVEHLADRLLDDVVERSGAGVKGRNRRDNDRATFRCLLHQAQMAGMQRCFPHGEYQPTAFLECHVGGAGNQGFVVRVGDGREALDRAGQHQHAVGTERTAGNGSSQIVLVMHDAGHGLDLRQRPGGFQRDGLFGRR